jgi:hypothetical protein
MVLGFPVRSGECAMAEYSGSEPVMQLSGELAFVFPAHTPGRRRSSRPIYGCGLTALMDPFSRYESASAGRAVGAVRGLDSHHASPCSASEAVALLVRLRWLPSVGGGGRREVSGTAICQSWDGGGKGGGAY